MIRNRTLQARDKLVGKLPVTGELLRARREGHAAAALPSKVMNSASSS